METTKTSTKSLTPELCGIRGSRDRQRLEEPAYNFDAEREGVQRTAKTKINDLLWVLLPPNMTMAEADNLACSWYEQLMIIWDQKKQEEDQCAP